MNQLRVVVGTMDQGSRPCDRGAHAASGRGIGGDGDICMGMLYARNPVLLVAEDDGTVVLAIAPRDLSLTTGDLFDLRRQAEKVGLQPLVVESVAVNSVGWLEEELIWAAHRRDAAATAPRSVPGLLAMGAAAMDHLALDLRIGDGLNDGINEAEPFGCLTPKAMAERLRFRLAYLDRQREIRAGKRESRNNTRAGSVVQLRDRRRKARPPEDVPTRSDVWRGALTRASELANKNGGTALTDAVRLLSRP